MQDKFLSSRMALDQRTAKLEQALDRCAQLVAQIPLRTWQFLITLLLVVWLSYSLARLFWLALPEPTIAPAALVLVAPTSATAVEAQALNIDQLKDLDIFGEAPQQLATNETVVSAPIEEETVDTKLNLVLMGVIASSDESAGRAIIAASGQQEMYAPGAELPAGNGVTLAKVMDLRVILNNNGRFESLWLYQDSDDPRRASIASSYATPEQAAGRSWSDENAVAGDDQQSPVFVDKSPMSDRRGGEGPNAEDPTAEITRNISDVVAMSIHREGGQVVGYKIRPGRNAEQFKAFGLEADDIVTAVNGVPLDNPGKIMEIYKNMSNATSASLEIKRGGSVLSVDIVLP